jgi:hypothetical protein
MSVPTDAFMHSAFEGQVIADRDGKNSFYGIRYLAPYQARVFQGLFRLSHIGN